MTVKGSDNENFQDGSKMSKSLIGAGNPLYINRSSGDFKPVEDTNTGYAASELKIPSNPDFPEHNYARPLGITNQKNVPDMLTYDYSPKSKAD